MAKLDLNQATREQLVDDAGLRPFVAEAVLRARDEQGGELADIGALKDALGEVRGIGPATLDQLGEVLKVGRGKPARPAAEKAADTPAPAVKTGAEEETADAAAPGVRVARRTAEEPAEAPAPAVKAGAGEVRRTVERTAEVASAAARDGAEAAGRAAGGLAEAGEAAAARSGEAAGGLGQLFAELARDQARANVEALRALARARTWGEALEVQGGFLRGNVGRMGEGAARYVGAVTRLAAGLALVGRGKGRTAA